MPGRFYKNTKFAKLDSTIQSFADPNTKNLLNLQNLRENKKQPRIHELIFMQILFYRKARKVFILRRFYKNAKFAKLCIEPALRTLCFYNDKLIQNLCVLCGKILNPK